jgi:broad specificity phosphatase PhoE
MLIPKPLNVAILIRHAESAKNLASAFSGFSDSGLTERGNFQLKAVASEVCKTIRKTDQKINVFSAPSVRALQTAAAFSRQLAVPVQQLGFRSIFLGSASALTESELAENFPQFSKELALYRIGLFNSYDMNYPKGSEDPIKFESDMYSIFMENFMKIENSVSIFVMHRSTMTAILLKILRSENRYPENFYGHVSIEHLSPFVIVGNEHGVSLFSFGTPLIVPH